MQFAEVLKVCSSKKSMSRTLPNSQCLAQLRWGSCQGELLGVQELQTSILLQRHEPAQGGWHSRALAAAEGIQAHWGGCCAPQCLYVSMGPPRACRLLLTYPLQNFKVVVSSCPATRAAIPWAPVLAQPLQNAEVAMSSSCTADIWTPFTAVLTGELQHCQVASSGCSRTCA